MTTPIDFTFDDGNTSDLWAAEVMNFYRLKGAFFVNEKPGIGFDIGKLLTLGHVVGNHTQAHQRLEGLSDEQIREAVGPWNEKLMAYGASGDYFSYPYSSGPYGNKVLHGMFKHIYRGYEEERGDRDGEISRVTVTNKTKVEVLGYTKPLQLHGIDMGRDFDISRAWFIALCEQRAKRHG